MNTEQEKLIKELGTTGHFLYTDRIKETFPDIFKPKFGSTDWVTNDEDCIHKIGYDSSGDKTATMLIAANANTNGIGADNKK